MILPTKGMKFRRKYASDKEPTNTRMYKCFFSKKVSKSHCLLLKPMYVIDI